MRPGNMIVVLDEVAKQPIEMSLVQNNHMVQKLSTQRAYEPFNKWILPRTSVRSLDLLNAAAIEERLDAMAVDAVVVAEQKPGLDTKRRGFTNLLILIQQLDVAPECVWGRERGIRIAYAAPCTYSRCFFWLVRHKRGTVASSNRKGCPISQHLLRCEALAVVTTASCLAPCS